MATYHGITKLECLSCGWVTKDDETMEIMNDMNGDCNHCRSQFFLWIMDDGRQCVSSSNLVRGVRTESDGLYNLVEAVK